MGSRKVRQEGKEVLTKVGSSLSLVLLRLLLHKIEELYPSDHAEEEFFHPSFKWGLYALELN
jgi:hypothetical protein